MSNTCRGSAIAAINTSNDLAGLALELLRQLMPPKMSIRLLGERLLFHHVPITSLEVEPSVGRVLLGKCLLGGASEQHVGGERLIVQLPDRPPPWLNHRCRFVPDALPPVVANDDHGEVVQSGHLRACGETDVEFLGQLSGRGQAESLHLPQTRKHHEIR